MDKVRFGVIGTGFMGSMHARAFAEMPQAELVAVADVNAQRAKGVAERFGTDWYTDFRQLISREDIDAVSICTLDKHHLEPTLLAIEKGKHIFLEKPITTDLSEADRIIMAANRARVKLQVGHLLRFDPRYAQVKHYIDSGTIGDPIHIYARRNSPRNEGPARYGSELPLALHVTVHDLDLILWYVQKEPTSIYARSISKHLAQLGIEDSLFAIISFDDGPIVSVESSWVLPAKSATRIDASLEIVGTKGMAEVNCAEQGLYLATDNDATYPDTLHWPIVNGYIYGDVREELIQFVNCVATDKPPLVTGEEAKKAVKLALAIVESAKTGEVVKL